MDFIPHTEAEIKEMLAEIGIKSLNELFKDIPKDIPRANLNLPHSLSEQELVSELKNLSKLNTSTGEFDNYLGAGSYEHYIPSVVDALSGRSEFVTAYTPYQAEASQGTLQTIYEYQSLICQLTGMDVSNASLYDGATALAEALLIAYRNKEINDGKIFISKTIHPEYRRVIKTYMDAVPVEIIEIPYKSGITDIDFLKDNVSDKTIAVALQSPNFFGCIEPANEVPQLAKKHGALSILSANPVSLGVLKDPGSMGFSIAVGEGQPLGLPLMFGGPYLGYFACKKDLVRKMPGRIVGRTKDKKGRSGFVLTLQTREQHIRREKATSNICSNEALCALRACIYLCTLGRQGMQELAKQNVYLSHYAKDKLCEIKGVEDVFDQPFFNEFVLKLPLKIDKFLEKKIIPGLDLGKFYPELADSSLWCVTEMKNKEKIDRLAEVIKCVLQ
jgi:glycine dehydrogenase subunit 1